MADEPIILTAPDGTETRIAGKRVIRIRLVISGESDEPKAKTRIDWVGAAYVQEAPTFVANAVRRQLETLAQLTLPGGEPVWFNAKAADGPIRTTRFERQGGVKSAMMLTSKKQYLASTPEEVSAAIAAAGGTPLPIPDEGLVNDLIGAIRHMLTPTERWE